MSRALLLFFAVAALTTCGVDLPDLPGRACDDSHPCRAPRECVAGFCFEVEASDGGTGGGSAAGGGTGASGGGAAAGGGSAAGGGLGTGGGSGGGSAAGGGMGAGGGGVIQPPLWKQSVHGFTGQSVLGSATLEVDTLRGNRVVSTIKSANDTNDRATANSFDAGRLPSTGQGRIRGRFQLPATLKLTNNSTFLWLGVGTSKPLLQLYFNSSGQLVANSGAGMLGPAAVSNTITFSGGFMPNVDYLVEVAWQRSGYRRVWINGLQVAQVNSLVGDAGLLEVPDQLRLGIYRYDGAADAGWSTALFDWQLTDNASVVLSD